MLYSTVLECKGISSAVNSVFARASPTSPLRKKCARLFVIPPAMIMRDHSDFLICTSTSCRANPPPDLEVRPDLCLPPEYK